MKAGWGMVALWATGCGRLDAADCSVTRVGDAIFDDRYTDCGFYGVFADRTLGAACVRDAFADGTPFLFREQRRIRDTTMTYGTVHLSGRVAFLYQDIATPDVVTAIECLGPSFSEEYGEMVCDGGDGEFTMCSPEGPSEGVPEPWARGILP